MKQEFDAFKKYLVKFEEKKTRVHDKYQASIQ